MQSSTIASFYWILIFNVLLSINSNVGNNTGLYSLGDKVEIFTVDNHKAKLYNQPFVWLVEFYAHWCGHCQHFAPIWRKFASDIQNWSPVVRLAAINCAEEANVDVCRQFQVDHYPTLRFFHQFYNPNDEAAPIGAAFPTLEDLSQLRTNLVEKLTQEQQIGRGLTWPLLINLCFQTDISGLARDLLPSTRYIILIIEPENATIGRELVLDFYALKQITVKVIKDANHQVLNQLRPKFTFQAPSLLVLDRKLSYLPITPPFKSRASFARSIRLFCQRKGIPVPEVSQPLYNKDFPIQYDRKAMHYDSKLLPIDKVYLADLENTLHYILNNEIAVQVSISGEKLTALRDFFRVVFRYFPLTHQGRVMYWLLLEQAELVQSEISGREVQEYAYALERTYKPYSQHLEWIRCKGSGPTKRGYPCGLWTLFHTLTMAEMKSSARSTVLQAMMGFVKHFFSCGYCSEHFQRMAERMNLDRVEDSAEAVLWLWQAHNLVNQRLAGDFSEDPEFPKGIYPKQIDCPECYEEIERNGKVFWNHNAVLVYLRRIYEKFVIFS